MQILQLVETRGGKIVRLANYYQPIESQVSPLRVANPLRSAPGPADTPAAAEAVALKYAAALQTKDAAAIAALSAPTIAFTDTASSTVGSSPGEVQAHYAGIFKAPADLAFTHLRYAFGRGWAAVIWTAGSSVVRGERRRRDHAGDPQRQDPPRDALLQPFQRPVLAPTTGSGRAGRLEIRWAAGEGRGHEGALRIQ